MLRGAVFACLAALCAGGAAAEITGARYAEPTDAYGHGAIAGGEYAALIIEHDGRQSTIRYDAAVFEDTAPRLADLDGDGSPEVIAVLSGFEVGARIMVYDLANETIVPVASNDPIGQRNRWLAIAGAADLDDDGRMEVAYVDRPHLAKVLRVIEISATNGDWRLVDEAAAPGLTNHRLGDPQIEGGIVDCGQGPEIMLASADWTRVMAVRLDSRALRARDIGPYQGPDSLRCP